ncbi:sulfurtransferase [Thermoflexus sp.]|uniref:sulfurtransferase n=1 Tax=Thermoflexus sp. TaxID=1969742 RepID=UPI00175A078C|nr:sulfurtransferase [Thermoflexus sp.]
MATYADPLALVDTEWVAQHLQDPKVRIVEVDYDPASAYHLGHIPGAVLFDWRKDLNDPVRRDILSKEAFEALNSRAGISNDTTVVLYGDFRNWFAAFAFWIYKYYGHADVRLLNGGRKKWIEEKRPLTEEVPSYPPTTYRAQDPDARLRAHLPYVLNVLGKRGVALVDVRSPAEFTGEITAPPEYPNEAAQRGGHIPGAVNIPWSKALNDDDTFKDAESLRRIYEEAGVTPDEEVITYCRIGERSSVTWFVLRHLLGYPNVRNYDGSWSEWGNTIGVPIER